MKRKSFVGLSIAAAIGLAYAVVNNALVDLYASYVPVIRWFSSTFSEPSLSVLFWVSLTGHDLLLNVLFAIPFAIVFSSFQSLDTWRSPLAAVLAPVIWTAIAFDWSVLVLAADRSAFWLNLSIRLISLPIAFAIVRAMRARWRRAQPDLGHHRRAAG